MTGLSLLKELNVGWLVLEGKNRVLVRVCGCEEESVVLSNPVIKETFEGKYFIKLFEINVHLAGV